MKNVVLTEGGCCYLHAVVQIEKTAEGEAKNAILAAFAAHQSLKSVVVVDADINPFDASSVEYAIATRVRWDEDVVFVRNARGSTLDPSSDDGILTKFGIDATAPLKLKR
ncbi:MAG: 3-polyprenyl-4-hydroxybenzoate decarboxylase [Methanophagales archaeon]|nr:UbiD family decarboxylase [Methanophagales archaeon]MCU4140541.1 3-polyprenyl-4-hydroxybenzoate decarboxylase [Methanophagales archaeon]